MPGAAELFTACRSCGQQVSTFVTECPYCGARLRRRAPRLERRDGDLEALLRAPTVEPDRQLDDDVVVPLKRRRKVKAPRAPKAPRPSRSRGGRASSADRRAWVTIVIVLLSLVGIPAARAVSVGDLFLFAGPGGAEPWTYATAALSYSGVWHGIGVLTTFGVFGWLWERRAGLLGSAVVLLTFLVAGVGGLALAAEAGGTDFYAGAGGAATALAMAWIVAELRARQRNESIDGDLLGAATLLALTLVTCAVSAAGAPVAAALGIPLGALLGLALSAARR